MPPWLLAVRITGGREAVGWVDPGSDLGSIVTLRDIWVKGPIPRDCLWEAAGGEQTAVLCQRLSGRAPRTAAGSGGQRGLGGGGRAASGGAGRGEVPGSAAGEAAWAAANKELLVRLQHRAQQLLGG